MARDGRGAVARVLNLSNVPSWLNPTDGLRGAAGAVRRPPEAGRSLGWTSGDPEAVWGRGPAAASPVRVVSMCPHSGTATLATPSQTGSVFPRKGLS